MKYHVLKPIQIAGLGRIDKGREVELPEVIAKLYLPNGAIEPVRVRELRENPVQPAGAPSSASQAGQASQQTTASESDDGDSEPVKKRRGRPRKGAQ